MLDRTRRSQQAVSISAFVALVLTAGLLAFEEKTLQVVTQLDLKRYLGTWFEVARLPNEFQQDCVSDVTATYTLRNDGGIDVVNRCREIDGSIQEAEGVARRVAGRPASVLEVRFAPAVLSIVPRVWGDYQVMALSPDYAWSVVGTPDRRYLWILSRTTSLDEEIYRELNARAAAQGFDVQRILRTKHAR